MKGPDISLFLLSLIAGILLSRIPEISIWYALIPVALALSLFGVNLFLSKKNPFAVTPRLNGLSGYCIFLAIGVFSGCISRTPELSLPEGRYGFQGKVLDFTPTNYGDRLLIRLDVITLPSGKSLHPDNTNALVTLGGATDVTYGDFINGKAVLRPYDTPGNYIKEDFERYLASKHIYLTGWASPTECEISKPAFSTPGDFFRNLRDRLERGVEKTKLSEDTKRFLISLLLGDKTYMKSDQRIMFGDAGVSHIFAVSGFHVSMISAFILAFLSIVFFGKNRKWKFIAAIPLIWFYVLLTGFSPATCRAGLMLTAVLVGFFLQRKIHTARILGWVVILILALNADALFDVGFQLSVVCAASLILIAVPLNFIDQRNHPALHKTVGLIIVTLTAVFSTWLICGYYFHRFSLMFLPLNLIAVPLLPAYVLCALFYFFMAFIGVEITGLKSLLDGGYHLFEECAAWCSGTGSPFTDFHPGGFSVLLWLAFLISVGYVLSIKNRKKQILLPSLLFSLAVLSLLVLPSTGRTGFIIQKNSKETLFSCYEQGAEKTVSVPEAAASTMEMSGKKITVLKSVNISEETAEALKTSDILLIGGGCNDFTDEIIGLLKKECRIITHPTLHWRYERNILKKAEGLNLDIHSVRYDGPYHHFD